MSLIQILTFPVVLTLRLLQSINIWTEISIIAIIFATWAKKPIKIPQARTRYASKNNYTPNYTNKTSAHQNYTYNADTQPNRTQQKASTPNDTWKTNENYDSNHIYQNKSVFTEREKFAFARLRSITEKHGYSVLAKVRLFDLIEPSFLTDNKKVAQYKIQAKHVDFVLCDDQLKAKYVIELDDSTHDRPDRIERDRFVDSVLTSAGYKVLHTRNVDEIEILLFIGII